jgi:hypothetical protein
MLFLLNVVTFANENIEPFSEEVLKAIDVLKQAIEAPYQNDKKNDYPKLEVQYNDYSEAVKKLGTLITGDQAKKLSLLSEPDLNQVLALMSHNITNYSEKLKELFSYYKKGDHARSFTPVLRVKHINKTFRSSWEYLLLSPPNKTVANFNSEELKIVRALFAIESRCSLPILDFYLKNKFVSKSFDYEEDYFLFPMLTYFPSAESLHYLLSWLEFCLSMNNGAFPKKQAKSYRLRLIKSLSNCYETPEGIERRNSNFNSLVPYILAVRGVSHLERQKWKEVILAYPKVDLPQWQKEFLDDVLKAIDEQEKKEAKTTK